MVRTTIPIPESDKKWLDRYSHLHNQSIEETVRQAIHCYQFQVEPEDDDTALRETAGLWRGRGKDGLAYQRKMRDEWEISLLNNSTLSWFRMSCRTSPPPGDRSL